MTTTTTFFIKSLKEFIFSPKKIDRKVFGKDLPIILIAQKWALRAIF
jgi:hypothetical protein